MLVVANARSKARITHSECPPKNRTGPLQVPSDSQIEGVALVKRKRDDTIAALGVDLDITAGANHDVLLAADRVRRGWRVDASAGLEFPQDTLPFIRVISLEPAVRLASEDDRLRPLRECRRSSAVASSPAI